MAVSIVSININVFIDTIRLLLISSIVYRHGIIIITVFRNQQFRPNIKMRRPPVAQLTVLACLCNRAVSGAGDTVAEEGLLYGLLGRHEPAGGCAALLQEERGVSVE